MNNVVAEYLTAVRTYEAERQAAQRRADYANRAADVLATSTTDVAAYLRAVRNAR